MKSISTFRVEMRGNGGWKDDFVLVMVTNTLSVGGFKGLVTHL